MVIKIVLLFAVLALVNGRPAIESSENTELNLKSSDELPDYSEVQLVPDHENDNSYVVAEAREKDTLAPARQKREVYTYKCKIVPNPDQEGGYKLDCKLGSDSKGKDD